MNINKPLFMQSGSESEDNRDFTEQAPATATAPAASDAMSNTDIRTLTPQVVNRAMVDVLYAMQQYKADVAEVDSSTVRELIPDSVYEHLINQRGEK